MVTALNFEILFVCSIVAICDPVNDVENTVNQCFITDIYFHVFFFTDIFSRGD